MPQGAISRRLGITDIEHNKMLHQLVDILEKRGMNIIVSRFEEPVKGDFI